MRIGQDAGLLRFPRNWPVILGCFCLTGLLATDYTLNYFYGGGAAALDAGWFAALESGPVSLSLPNPSLIGGSFFSFHISPVFVLLAALHRLLLPLPAPMFFALTQGFWHATLGAAAALCATRCMPGRPLLATLLGLTCAGNGTVLAMLGFPHLEIAIPALLLATLVLRFCRLPHRGRWLWAAPLLLLLTIREDAGFHCAAIFGCLAVWQLWNGDRRGGSAGLCIALASASFSAGEILLQRHLFPAHTSMFAIIYSGTPPFAHVSRAFLWDRLDKLFENRAYVWVPGCAALLAALVRRDVLPALGSLACLPWLALACVAVQTSAGEMVGYYGFPMMTGLMWPMVAALPALQGNPAIRRFYLQLQFVMLALSIGLFVAFGSDNHDPQPWNSLGFGWMHRAGPMEAFTDDLLSHRSRFGHIVVDDAVVSLRMADYHPGEWRYQMRFSPAEQHRIDTLVSQPGTWTDGLTRELLGGTRLTTESAVKGTFFVIRSRQPAAPPPHS